jgi:hypothetical protein
MIWATVGGFARFITNRQHVTWEQSALAVSPRARRAQDNAEA